MELTLKLSPQVVTRLEGLRAQTNALSISDVVEQAINVFDTLLANEQSGGKTLLVDGEGNPLAELRVLEIE